MPCVGSITYHIAAVAATYVDIEGYTVVAITYCIDKDIIYPHAVYIDVKGITLHAAIGIVDCQGKLIVAMDRVNTQGTVFGIHYCGRTIGDSPGEVVWFFTTFYIGSPLKGCITITDDRVVWHGYLHCRQYCHHRAVYILAAVSVGAGKQVGEYCIGDKRGDCLYAIGSQAVDTLAPLIAYACAFYQLTDQVNLVTSAYCSIGKQGLYAYRIYCYLSGITNCTIVFVINIYGIFVKLVIQ